eukprot:4081215-Pleurochrysis_carterae.AAC.1
MAKVVPACNAVLVAGTALAHCACAARAQRLRHARSARLCSAWVSERCALPPTRRAAPVQVCPAGASVALPRTPCGYRPLLCAAHRPTTHRSTLRMRTKHCTKVPTSSGGQSHEPLDAVHQCMRTKRINRGADAKRRAKPRTARRCACAPSAAQKCRRRAVGRAMKRST